MQNSEYWKLRFEQLEAAQNGQGAAAVAEIERQYKEAQKQIEGQIARWYQRFADNNGISLAEARQYLKGAALKEFKWDVQDYIKYGQDNALMGGWMKELENASAKYHISKLEALKIQTQQSLEVMFSKQLGTVTGAMGDVFESGYYHTAYELQKGFNIGWDIAGLDQSQIEKVLAKPWAVDGKNFSERIWGNKQKLISEVHGELTQNIMLGADPQKAIDSLAKKMKTSRYNAGRLIMTEEAYFSSAAQKDCFEELGVEQFEIVATLDSHTSDICRSLDGKHFPMKDYQPGVTAPPFHVFCRSTTVPYFDEDFGDIGERAARDEETGKTYYIPDDMNYQDWKETFVDGGDKSGFDVVDDGFTLHYKHHKEPEPPPPPKKEYLTKKKLQAKIAEADVQLEDLEIQFKAVSGGWTYEEAIKDFGSLDGLTDGDDLAKLKDLHSQAEAIESQKAEWQEKLNEKLKAEQKKALAKKQLELEAEKAAIQQQLDDFEIKTYSGIWYGKDVTTADWQGLNIAGKKQYYEGKFITETDPDLMKKYQDFYKQLEELDAEGSNYHDIQQQLKKIEQEIAKVQSDLKNVEKSGIIDTAVDDAFSQARKDAAIWAKSTKEADDVLRDVSGQVWQAAPKVEKDAIYEYTSSYSKFNEPLRGIEYGTNAVKGVGNIDFDTIGTNYGGYKPGQVRKQINAMTDIIEKSTYDVDVWLQRGCDYRGMDSFFEISMSDLQNASQAELEKLLLGKTVTDYGFFSCGVSKGKGFSHKPIIMNVYAPKGTKMMYAEPFSAFGNGSGRSWDGVSRQSSFGSESEIILQQGTSFRVTKVEKTGGKLYVDIEVILQNPPQR
jgi:SPP1 gp7 family putative phage head morphogenesis protein